MKDHNKITFAREYCLCRRIPYRIKAEALYIKRCGKYQQICFSLYNLTHVDIIRVIDGACEYDDVTTFYIDK